jgi:hypothetical protein
MPLLSTTTLPGGLRVRIRLPQRADRTGLIDLSVRLGAPLDEVAARRALTFDPRRRMVMCATGWLGGSETLLGVGTVDRGAAVCEIVLADEESAPGVSALLASALTDWARGPQAGAA